MKLPTNYVSVGLELSKGMTMFGIDVSELTRDELLACVAMAYKKQQHDFERRMKEMDFMEFLRKARP